MGEPLPMAILALTLWCPCGRENVPMAKFCARCGRRLLANAPEAEVVLTGPDERFGVQMSDMYPMSDTEPIKSDMLSDWGGGPVTSSVMMLGEEHMFGAWEDH